MLPECEPPRTTFGAPIRMRDAGVMQAARRLDGGRKFRDRHLVANGIGDVLVRRVVVACERHAVLAAPARPTPRMLSVGIALLILEAAARTARRARPRSGRPSCRDSSRAASPRRGTGAGPACGPSARSAARPAGPRASPHPRPPSASALRSAGAGSDRPAAGRPARAVSIAAERISAWPSTSSAPSSRQTRSESSTVVMPLVASWPS